ncbi:prepilin-type N-terminal cleavage/methylation domain-containing protein [Dehalococcoidia bacterium]|nr:prepilin-type N-terminal cleavage/methylation domain-containing protein [Dehalococcoidia bacterium]
MKRLIEKARKIHRNQKGFTLIELLVVMAILAILVGLIVPNFLGVTDEADAIMIQGQYEKMREVVYLYHLDTGEWPTEWSEAALGDASLRQLWHADDVSGWDGPYIERPILQENRWGGFWGVRENRRLNLTGSDNRAVGGGVLFTTFLYQNVPLRVAMAVDKAMDDGVRYTGAVQYGGVTWPNNHPYSGGIADEDNFLAIIIARQ